MDENHNKTVLTVKQRLKLLDKFEDGDLVTELAKDYGVKTKLLCP